MIVEGQELFGKSLSRHINTKISQADVHNCNLKGDWVDFKVQMIDFTNPFLAYLRLKSLGHVDIVSEIRANNKCNHKVPIIPIAYSLSMTPIQLWVYHYLFGLSQTKPIERIIWDDVQKDSGIPAKDFWEAVLYLEERIVSHPIVDYPLLITGLHRQDIIALSEGDDIDGNQ